MTLEELQVIITAKTAGLQAELKNVGKQLKGMQETTQKTTQNMQKSMDSTSKSIATSLRGVKVALAALGITKAIADSFKLARSYEASMQQINRLLKQNSVAFQSWVEKNALTFGMARADAMKYGAVYSNLLKGFITDTNTMTHYTQEMLKASSIIASSTGRTMTDVMERMRSGMLGNTEAIEDLGIYVNVALLKTTDAFKQLANGRTWEQLDFQTQQQIRMMSILEQTSKSFGDSVQNNTNFQLMQLSAQLKDAALNIGNAFMPIVNVVLPILNNFAASLVKVTNILAVFMNTLFGTNMKQISNDTKAMSDGLGGVNSGLGDATGGYKDVGKEAEKAGKKAKGALASFDEVNQLNFGAQGGGNEKGIDIPNAGINLEDTPPIDQAAAGLENRLSKMVDAIKVEFDRLKEIFKDGFEIGLGTINFDSIKTSTEGIKQAIDDIFSNNQVVQSAQTMIDAIALSFGKSLGAWASIGATIATNLLGGINNYLTENAQYIKDRLVGIFDISSEIANILGDFSVAFADIFSVFGGETAQQVTANIIGMFANGFIGATELALKFGKDILNCITQPIIDNKDKIKLALENTLKPLETITSSLKDLITNTFKSALDAYDKYIEPTYQRIAEGLSKIVGVILDAYNTYIAPTIDAVASKCETFYTEHLQPVIDKIIEVMGKLVLAGSQLYKNVLAPFVTWLIDYMAPCICLAFESISDIFLIVAAVITDVIKGLLTSFGGFIDFMTGVFTGDWEKCWDGIKAYYKGTVDTFLGLIVTPLTSILDFVKNNFTKGWTIAWEGVQKIFKGVFDGLVGIAKGPINLIIEAINVMIDGLNKISFDMPNWNWIPDEFQGASFGINIPNIPRLARGGIVDGATNFGNYIAGEAGKEMIVPLENTSFVAKLASSLGNAVMMAMQFNNSQSSTNDGTLILELDGTEIGRAIIPGLKKEIKRTGVRLV